MSTATTLTVAADVAAFRASTAPDIETAARWFRVAPVPELTAEDITVTVDNMGREIIVIPDAIAAEIAHEVRRGWREFRGLADGESRQFAPGTWMHRTTELIMTTYAASTPAEALTLWPEPDTTGQSHPRRTHAEHARIDRERASGPGGSLAGAAFIIGRSGWDFAARWWAFDVRSLAHRSLRPGGSPARASRGAGLFIRYAG
jgi:hypothetical protein